MRYYKHQYILFLLFFFVGIYSYSQGSYTVENKRGRDKINFNLVNNVIIVPIEVNGIELSFLLDTGVNKPILFNFLKNSDSLSILNAERIYLKGLGNNESIEALKSSNNIFKIGDAINRNQAFYVVFDSSINFAPKLGVPIHGIIGYDIFKDLIIDINYRNKYIRLTNPDKYKYKSCRRCEVFNLQFYNNKPYFGIAAEINNKIIPVKLLIDSGSSNSLWLFKNDSLGITISKNYFDDFLGYGLSGSIYGKRSKIDGINLKSFKLDNPKVDFPEDSAIKSLKKIKGRNGSIGGEILKRFNITIDFRKAKMTLRKNANFKDKFHYNKSGLDLEYDGIRLVTESYTYDTTENPLNSSSRRTISIRAVYATKTKFILTPSYSITQIRENSPAAIAGLKLGDVLIKINDKDTKNYKLQDILTKFYDDDGKRIKLEVERNGAPLTFTFYLKSPLN